MFVCLFGFGRSFRASNSRNVVDISSCCANSVVMLSDSLINSSHVFSFRQQLMEMDTKMTSETSLSRKEIRELLRIIARSKNLRKSPTKVEKLPMMKRHLLKTTRPKM